MERFRNWVKLLLLHIGLAFCLATSSHAFDVTLQWDGNTESDLAGYKIYYRTRSSRGGVLGNYDGTGACECDAPVEMTLAQDENSDQDIVGFSFSGLLDGKTYFFVVTTYDDEIPANIGRRNFTNSALGFNLLKSSFILTIWNS